MKTDFTSAQLTAAGRIIRGLYNLPRSRLLSNEEIRTEIAVCERKNREGSADDMYEVMHAKLSQAGVI